MSRARLLFIIAVITGLCGAAAAQENQRARSTPIVAAAVSQDGVRFASSSGAVVQMRVQIVSTDGRSLFDSDWKSGNVLDWMTPVVPYGAYSVRLLTKDLEGRVAEKQATLRVAPEGMSIDPAAASDLKMTATLHNGETGQLVTTSGDLSFRFGDYLNRRDTEAMRLTAGGELQVKGLIRTGEGIMFPDGSVQRSAAIPSIVRMQPAMGVAQSGGGLHPRSDTSGTGTTNQITKWLDTNGALGDSAISETGGAVTIGSIAAQGQVQIAGSATQDVFSGMGPNIVAGPAMNYGYAGLSFGRGAGFFNVRPDSLATAPNPSLRFMTRNVQRVIITNLGDVGIATLAPSAKLEVAGNLKISGSGNELQFPDATSLGTATAGGDLSGTYPNPSVATVGGETAANVASGAALANSATDLNTPSTIVKRDATGNFSAGTITGALNGNATTASTATNFSGTLGGEVTGTQAATVVSNAVSTNTGGSIVRRDATGNFSAGTVTLAGNLGLPPTSGFTVGVITLGGSRFAHNFGTENTFLGVNAGNFTTTGNDNTAAGVRALGSNGVGLNNTASGADALFKNTSGSSNTAIGGGALYGNTTGSGNLANGYSALFNSTGDSNIAVGANAGQNLTTGSNNIDIGHLGVAAEAATIRIGTGGTHTRAFIAGINAATTAGAAVPVYVDVNGQLGTNGGSAPTSSNTPNTIVLRDGSGNFAAGTITAALSGNATTATTATNFSGSLAGEVTGTQGATVVSNAVSTNTASAIVRRDSSGSFSAGSVTLAGNLAMPFTTSSSVGVITMGGFRFAQSYGTNNTSLGLFAGSFTTTGSGNTALGTDALAAVTSGSSNTASGDFTLYNNGIGFSNTATGSNAMSSNTTGNTNTAAGVGALYNNVGGSSNTAIGVNALFINSSGNRNIGVGYTAGNNLTTGSDNIDIGNAGLPGESITIRIGTSGTQTRAFIAGINSATTGVGAVPVVIDSAGQLGTTSSSRRYKFDISSMGDATEGLMRLRPVTFRYLAHGENAPLQYGLIAEEVAEVYPELVARNKDGEIETVMYQFLAPMLLNEAQKQQRQIEEQHQQIEQERARLDREQRRSDQLTSENAALRERLERLEKIVEHL